MLLDYVRGNRQINKIRQNKNDLREIFKPEVINRLY